MTPDRAAVIIVLAKQPRPGRVKTRLQGRFSATESAQLAAAALSDTLRAVRASGARRRLLAWEGDPSGWDDGFEVLAQPDGDLGVRLAAAFDATRAGRSAGEPVLLVGMDTPQLTPGLLDQSWRGADAVLGLSEDGGFWAIGLRSADPHAVFDGIPMSSERTGAAQLARLTGLGLTVELLPPLRDVDLPVDAEAVADANPRLEFSRCYAELAARRSRQPVDRLFDQLYGGRTVTSRSAAGFGGDCFLAGRARWLQPADPVDAMVVSRCEPPVIDIGCGPGRMVTALQRAGRPALGIDISKTAVALGAGRGGQILRRRLDDPLPAEGRWGTALLLDGNIGIGGDIAQLLTRCRDLVGAGGLIICEIQTDPDCAEQYDIVLSGGDQASHPLAWASAGLHTVQRVAAELDLIIAEEWRAGGRAFVSMRAGA